MQPAIRREKTVTHESPLGIPQDNRRWLILCIIAIAQSMVVLDVTLMNIALPWAQRVTTACRTSIPDR